MRNNITTVTLIRHGETEWNRIGKQQGQLNSPLSQRGMAQARAIAKSLEKEKSNYDALYSSDLGRAVQTAEAISEQLGLEINLDLRLRERNLGILQGLTIEEFREEKNEEYKRFRSRDPDYIILDGESIRERHERAVSCLFDIADKHKGQKIIIVAHGGILDSIFRKVFNIELTAERKFSLLNSSINTFIVLKGEWSLTSWGNVSHLDGIAALDDF